MMENTDKAGNLLSPEAVRAFIDSVTPDMVLSVYSGRCGCMCGCKGNHRYNPLHRAEASADRGYDVDADECSSRSVSLILNKMKRDERAKVQDGRILHFSDAGRDRQYAVYLRKGAAI